MLIRLLTRLALVFVALLALPSLASAQAITQWTLRTYIVGAVAPLVPAAVLLPANVTCNQPAPVGAVNVNPNRAVWTDPVNVGMTCQWTDPGTGPLASVPFGGAYESTLTATNSVGTSAESAPRSPFTRPGLAPAVPTGLQVVK